MQQIPPCRKSASDGLLIPPTCSFNALAIQLQLTCNNSIHRTDTSLQQRQIAWRLETQAHGVFEWRYQTQWTRQRKKQRVCVIISIAARSFSSRPHSSENFLFYTVMALRNSTQHQRSSIAPIPFVGAQQIKKRKPQQQQIKHAQERHSNLTWFTQTSWATSTQQGIGNLY